MKWPNNTDTQNNSDCHSYSYTIDTTSKDNQGEQYSKYRSGGPIQDSILSDVSRNAQRKDKKI